MSLKPELGPSAWLVERLVQHAIVHGDRRAVKLLADPLNHPQLHALFEPLLQEQRAALAAHHGLVLDDALGRSTPKRIQTGISELLESSAVFNALVMLLCDGNGEAYRALLESLELKTPMRELSAKKGTAP